MKKLLAVILAAALVLSMNTVVFADSSMDPDHEQAEVEVSYSPSTNESYIVTVPASVTVGIDPNFNTLTVSATEVKLESSHKLQVSVASENNFSLKDVTKDSSISYTCRKNGSSVPVQQDEVILSVAGEGTATGKTGSQALDFLTTQAAIDAATHIGKHTDTLTFTCVISK